MKHFNHLDLAYWPQSFSTFTRVSQKFGIKVTSVPQKNVPSTVVYYYCAWYVFLRDRRYIGATTTTTTTTTYLGG